MPTVGAPTLVAPAVGPPGPGPLVVSITFDDTFAIQYDFARPLLDGLPATFYVNSPRLGRPGYMTRAQLDDLVRAGHEIGSHTLHHLHLSTLDGDAQRTEICDDRQALIAAGFAVRTMAFPFGDENASARAVARSCGFDGARDVGGLYNANPLAGGKGYCASSASNLAKPDAEQIPPVDPFGIRSRTSIHADCTPDDLRAMVLNAAGGVQEVASDQRRWLVLTFHDFCDDCSGDTTTVRKDVFRDFVEWLRARNGEIAGRPLVVKTVADVLASPVP
jgi:peptidoglycan/xylan/chitin deacetylase (PgdA/CDA1 family)